MRKVIVIVDTLSNSMRGVDQVGYFVAVLKQLPPDKTVRHQFAQLVHVTFPLWRLAPEAHQSGAAIQPILSRP
jgi:hypothetical protein